ncbi:hypothetical protein JCM3766R1_002444 [Sporobolomyces carnicolor]
MTDSAAPTRAPSLATENRPPRSSLASLLPGPSAGTTTSRRKRADLISIKQQLALVLDNRDHDHDNDANNNVAEQYWHGLTEFVVGKITRHELGQVLERTFTHHSVDRQRAVNLHNALLLSILYNTTRATLPSSSIRHHGFNPRGAKKRNLFTLLGQGGYEGDEETDEQAHRRKQLKRTVLSVGKRERQEIKANANNNDRLLGRRRRGGDEDDLTSTTNLTTTTTTTTTTRETVGTAMRTSRGGQGSLVNEFVPKAYMNRGDEDLSGQLTSTPLTRTNFTQEYNRLIQAPLCCESRALPDADTLTDRMTLIAYEEGMLDGTDGAATATLLSNAVDSYIKQILSSAISLVRGPAPAPQSSLVDARRDRSTFAPAVATRATGTTTTTLAPHPETSSPGTPPPPPPPPVRATTTSQSPKQQQQQCRRRRRNERPLTISDFHALFAIEPALVGPNGSTHSSAVERMYALAPASDSDDESTTASAFEDERDGVAATTKTTGDVAAAAARDANGDTFMTAHQAAAGTLDQATTTTTTNDHDDDKDGDGGDTTASANQSQQQGSSGKMPRLSTASRNRTLSFYGSARPLVDSASAHTTGLASTASSSSLTGAGALGDQVGAGGGGGGEGSASGGGRTKFLLDPTSLHGVPEGHPDVPHVASVSGLPPPLLSSNNHSATQSTTTTNVEPGFNGGPASSSSNVTTYATGSANANHSQQQQQTLSPKSLSLRNSLFPELANPSAAAAATGSNGSVAGGASSHAGGEGDAAARRQGGKNGNGTTTDEADSELDDLVDQVVGDAQKGGSKHSMSTTTTTSGGAGGSGTPSGGGGLKIKLGGATAGTVTPTGASSSNVPTPGGSGGGGTKSAGDNNSKDKDLGRKLWEVVDSVRLLDGVLDP